MDDVPAFTPVNLITGFLGSGKTTLLQRLLDDPAMADTAVLINEFGEVGLDHHLLDRIDDTMVLLPSGCLCCTIRGELSAAIRDLHGRRERGEVPPFRRLAVESTGLADPFPILSTVQADPVLRHHFRWGNIVTTIDAVNGGSQLDRRPESVKQAAVADRLVLTKSDLVTGAQAEALVARLRTINPSAPLVRAAEEPIRADALLAHDLFAASARAEAARRWFTVEEGAQAHGAGVQAFVLALDETVDWTRFGLWLTMLLNRHGEKVLRVKGMLNVEGSDAPVAIHGVQYLVHPPVHMAAWPDDERRSRLVFIVDGLEPAAIEGSLRAFLRR
ncbi:MAG: GTP-binding protein [Reyranella sp.]|uniref:CobW family GTP-binding protein n=1 Tax=Reyranella sp. TaxID=1929291 RepID=UPI0012126D5F|nr:GTP-binding protein [Reyranella sp.]TAJ98246.1 MAG: GTP-binding protein [Reyranella sp.]TBR27474.1 MAG: GTP-binding protein [Reyranella sp.]